MDIRHDVNGAPMRTLATFERYEDAQELVDRLSDRGFPVQRVSIVGRDVRIVERVTGRLDAWRAALTGLAGGAALGGFFGLLFGLLFTHDGVSLLALVLYWIVVAAFWGAVLGVVSYATAGGSRRNFASVPGIAAGAYDVVVEEPVAAEAARLLEGTTSRTASAAG